jgi:hypothetical protein
MDWKDILKVDRFIFDPNQEASGYYNPKDDEVVINLSSFGGMDEDEIVETLGLVALHEYAHKAVNDEIKPLYDELGRQYLDALVGVLIEGQPLGNLTDVLHQIAEVMALDEAFAYSSQYNIYEGSGIQVDRSVLAGLGSQFDSLANDIAQAITREQPHRLNDFKAHAQKVYTYFVKETVKVTLMVEQKVREFLSKNLSDPENKERLEQVFGRKIDALRRLIEGR